MHRALKPSTSKWKSESETHHAAWPPKKKMPKHFLQILMGNSLLSGHNWLVHTQNTHTATPVCARTTTETFPRQTHQMPAAVQSKQERINVCSDGSSRRFRCIVNYFHTLQEICLRKHVVDVNTQEPLCIKSYRSDGSSSWAVGGLLTFCKYT